jgi:NAD(P)H-binding
LICLRGNTFTSVPIRALIAQPELPGAQQEDPTMRAFVTGSTGYIGSRLIPALLEAGHDVVAGMRDPDRASEFGWSDAVQVRRFDLQEPDGIAAAVADTDVAYFLVHSMDDKGFEERDGRTYNGLRCSSAQDRRRSNSSDASSSAYPYCRSRGG